MSYVEEIDRLTAENARLRRERDEARAVVARVRTLWNHWDVTLTDECPACYAAVQDACDHQEGYYHAYSELKGALTGPAPVDRCDRYGCPCGDKP